MKRIQIACFVAASLMAGPIAASEEEHSHDGHHDATTEHAQMSHEHHDAAGHEHDVHDHSSHDSPAQDPGDDVHDSHDAASAVTLTHTSKIDAALALGGEPVVADVMGVVCDFCALAMNKIFSKRDEVAAVYVDLDTKALSLVFAPGTSLSDDTIAELAVQAGYRIAAIRRGDAALGSAI